MGLFKLSLIKFEHALYRIQVIALVLDAPVFEK